MLVVEYNHQSVRVTFTAPFLYLKEDQEVWVTSTDVDEVVRGACINVSVIHVYNRYLVEEVISAVHGEYVTFICPHRISAEECKRNFLDVVGYVKHAFNSKLKKKHSMSRVILVPYNENNHWILMAIDLCDGIMYQYDPLPLQEPRQLSCENVFDIAYKSYRARIKKSTKIVLDVIRVECAHQTGGTDCGYYVMKYMHDIVKKVIECKGDVKQIKDYTTRPAPYSKGELDEIREQWAKLFRLNFLLS